MFLQVTTLEECIKAAEYLKKFLGQKQHHSDIVFFVSLRARKNDEFGSLDRAEFDPAYCHSIMSGYSPPA